MGASEISLNLQLRLCFHRSVLVAEEQTFWKEARDLDVTGLLSHSASKLISS